MQPEQPGSLRDVPAAFHKHAVDVLPFHTVAWTAEAADASVVRVLRITRGRR